MLDLPEALEPFRYRTVDVPSDDRMREVLANAVAPNTRRTYLSQWKQWQWWASLHGLPDLGAIPETVAQYLVARADAGAAVSTLRAGLQAIGMMHRLAGLPNPTHEEVVKLVVRSLGRAAATRTPRQARALLNSDLGAIRATAMRPRRGRGRGGAMEPAVSAARRGQVDIALLLLLRSAGLRRSEAAALRWQDLEHWDDGTGRLTVRKGKTDQLGAGHVVALTRMTMEALTAIHPMGADPDSLLFGLSAAQLNRRVKAATRAAGLPEGYSSHSGRVGLARAMVASGASLPLVMQQGRWRSSTMVAVYTRGESVSEALRYLDES